MKAGQADLIEAEELGFLNCFGGALIRAGTAADADIGIDDVLVLTLGNCLDGTLLSAGAALDTGISDYVSHDITSIYDVKEHAN